MKFHAAEFQSWPLTGKVVSPEGMSMTEAEKIRRRILTFAFVRTNFAQSTDPIAALRPFFVPIANELAEQPFDPAVFRSEMQKRYDLHLSRDVTELFIRRMTQLHYLQVTGDARKIVWKRQGVSNETGGQGEDSQRIDEILAKARVLHDGRRDLLRLEFDEDAFLSGLMKLLLNNTQIQSAVEAVESLSDAGVLRRKSEAGPRIVDPDQYFASEFVSWAKRNDPKIFDWVADLSGAAMVSEALIEIRTPTPNQNIRPDLEAYLDAPVAMELLGVSGRAAQEDAKAIVDGLRRHNVPISILAHSVEEVSRNLRAVLSKPPQQRTGATALALLHGEVREQEVAELAADAGYFIRALGIQIVDPKKLTHLASEASFSVEDEHNFFASIQSHYQHIEAAEKDAASVAWVMRRRKGMGAKDVFKAKLVLLTRNDRLYRAANRYCRDRAFIEGEEVGPIVLVRDMAGILWIIGGSTERESLSKRQLLLNCQRARANAPEIVGSMYATIRSVNPDSAELFWASVQRPAYMAMALDAVAAGGATTSEAVTDDVLEKIRDDLVSAERAKGREALKRAAEKYDQDASLREVVIASLERVCGTTRGQRRAP